METPDDNDVDLVAARLGHVANESREILSMKASIAEEIRGGRNPADLHEELIAGGWDDYDARRMIADATSLAAKSDAMRIRNRVAASFLKERMPSLHHHHMHYAIFLIPAAILGAFNGVAWLVQRATKKTAERLEKGLCEKCGRGPKLRDKPCKHCGEPALGQH